MGGQFCQNFAYVVYKAHVQHTICFIKDQDFQLGETDRFLVMQVQQAARRGHYDFRILAEQGLLVFEIGAACNGLHLDRCFGQELAAVFVHLPGKLPRRDENQGQGAGLAVGRCGQDLLCQRDKIGQRLAAASFRANPQVLVGQSCWYHLALDLGLDREDPRSAMQAYIDAVERRIDVGRVNGRLFVNNVSLGLYATIVQSPEYRDSKVEVSRSMATSLLSRDSEPFDLEYTNPKGEEIDGAFVIMVSNNPYTLGAKRDVAQRREIDGGQLGVFAISTRTANQAARLVALSAMGMRDVSKYWYEFATEEFEVRSRSGIAYAGVDGEALEMQTPLTFTIEPSALRLFVPDGNLEIVEQRRARNLRIRDLVQVALGHEPHTHPAPVA